MKDLTDMRKIAEAPGVRPGPWHVYDRGIGYEVRDENDYELTGGMRETFDKADATHIATFDPPTVLALLNRIADLEAKLSRAKNVAGVMASRNVELTACNREAQDRLEQAEAAVARVREAINSHPRTCDRHTEDDPVKCGWQRAVIDVQDALDGEQG